MEATRRLHGTTPESLNQNFRGKPQQGKKGGLTSQSEAAQLSSKRHHQIDVKKPQGPSASSSKRDTALTEVKVLPWPDTTSVDLQTKGFPLCSGAKRQLFQTHKLPRTLQVKLTKQVARKAMNTSKVLHLRKSVVRIKFQNALQKTQGPAGLAASRKKRGKPASLLVKNFRQRRCGGVRDTMLHPRYPELVGKRIRHLYEEKDKTEAWYQGVVLRVHKRHKDPLKTVYEVKYDSEPQWQYYLEILQDYKKGWLQVDE